VRRAWIIALFFSLFSSSVSSAASMLILSGHYGYGLQNIFGEDQVPSYRGSTYGFDVEYVVGRRALFSNSFLFGPFFSQNYMNGENTANNETQQENLRVKNSILGLKLYVNPLYFKIGIGKKDFRDELVTDSKNILLLKGTSFNAQTGLTFDISQSWKVDFGLDASYTKINALENNLSQRLDHWQFSGLISLGYILSSGRDAAAE